MTFTSFLLKYFNDENNENTVFEEVPQFTELQKGKYVFFINKFTVKTCKDFGKDGYHPWTGKTTENEKVSTKSRKFFVCKDENERFQESKTPTEYLLKVMQNTHVKNPNFKRDIAYISDFHDNLISNILYVYECLSDISTPLNENDTMKPSDYVLLKEALTNRTSSEAKKFLADKGIFVSSKKLSSVSRSVPTHVKSNQGKKSATDFYDILDRFLHKPHSNETLDTPKIDVLENGDIDMRVIVGYPDSFTCFGVSLPTADDIRDHYHDVNQLEHMSEREANEYFATFLKGNTQSGTIPLIGNMLQIDTTFCLSSAEYVTLLLGVSDIFFTKTSSKNSSVLLAFMIHSKKHINNHEKFSEFINTMLEKYCSNKVVGTIVHDGEESFKVYHTGSVLKNSIALRCDVHKLENIKEVLRKQNDLSYSEVKEILYGSKRKTACGSILKKGILESLSRKEYTEKMMKFINSSNDPLKTWLTVNFDSLFNEHSMFRKLLGGWPAQFVSTNVIESRNSHIKLIITKKKPGQVLLDDFRKIHEEEKRQMINAVCGLESKYITHCGISYIAWKRLSVIEKKHKLAEFGLQVCEVDIVIKDIPKWVYADFKVPDDAFLTKLDVLRVQRSESERNFFFVLSKTDAYDYTYVIFNEKELSCYHYLCKKNQKAFKLCVHRVAVLLILSEDERTRVLTDLEEKKNNFSLKRIMTNHMRPEHGMKIAKRHGSQASQNNESRNYISIVDTTASSIDHDHDDSTFFN